MPSTTRDDDRPGQHQSTHRDPAPSSTSHHDEGWTGLPEGTVETDGTTPLTADQLRTQQAHPSVSEAAVEPLANRSAAPTGLRRVLAPLALPLYFIIMMSVAYVSALHAPRPHEAPLVLAGPQQVLTQVASALEQGAPGAFTVSTATDGDAARAAVTQRDAIGALLLTPDPGGAAQVTAYVASGGGQAQVSTVTRVADQVAGQLGTTAAVEDVAPAGEHDPTGTGLFYLLIVATIAGYLTVTVLSQAAPDLALRTTYTVVGGTAVLAPVISMLLMSIFVGGYGASFAHLAATYGVAVLYTFTAGAVAVLLTQLLGRAAIFGLMLVMVFVNFPAAGGGVPAALLPGFWQGVHAFWLGSAGMEAFRSIIYFDGAGVGRWLLQLGTWAVVSLLASLTLGRRVAHRRATAAAPGAESVVMPA